jgi:hypothetical protein
MKLFKDTPFFSNSSCFNKHTIRHVLMEHASKLFLFSKYCSTPLQKFNAFKITFLAEEVTCYVSNCKAKKTAPGWLKIFQQKGKKHKFLCHKHSNEYSSELKEPIEIVFN